MSLSLLSLLLKSTRRYLLRTTMRGPWERKQFWRPIIVAPQREAAVSKILNLEKIRNIMVHMIVLLIKVVIKLSEGEAVDATLEDMVPPALWFPQVLMQCPLRVLYRV